MTITHHISFIIDHLKIHFIKNKVLQKTLFNYPTFIVLVYSHRGILWNVIFTNGNQEQDLDRSLKNKFEQIFHTRNSLQYENYLVEIGCITHFALRQIYLRKYEYQSSKFLFRWSFFLIKFLVHSGLIVFLLNM